MLLLTSNQRSYNIIGSIIQQCDLNGYQFVLILLASRGLEINPVLMSNEGMVFMALVRLLANDYERICGRVDSVGKCC